MRRSAVFKASESDSEVFASGRLDGGARVSLFDEKRKEADSANVADAGALLTAQRDTLADRKQQLERQAAEYPRATDSVQTPQLQGLQQRHIDRQRVLGEGIEQLGAEIKAQEQQVEKDADAFVSGGFNPETWQQLGNVSRKAIAENYIEMRPPYTAKPTVGDVERALTWISKKEDHTSSVASDKVYQFVYLVAGHLGENMDRMLKYDVDRRRSTATNFDIPGVDSSERLDEARKKLQDQVDRIGPLAKKQQAFDTLVYQIGLLGASRRLTQAQNDFDVEDKEIIRSYYSTLYGTLDQGTEGDTAATPTRTGLVEYIEEKQAVLPESFGTSSNLTVKDTVLTDPDEYLVSYLTDNTTKGFYAGATKADIPLSDVYSGYAATLARLEAQLSAITMESLRRQQAETLGWLERPEVLRTADMNEEMFMGLNKATTLVLTRIRGMQRLPQDTNTENVLVNTNNRLFFSHFAELTGKVIEQTRYFSRARGTYDRNFARLSMLIDRLLGAMSTYVYANNEIRGGGEPSLRAWDPARMAY
jgi:hypothetical protein